MAPGQGPVKAEKVHVKGSSLWCWNRKTLQVFGPLRAKKLSTSGALPLTLARSSATGQAGGKLINPHCTFALVVAFLLKHSPGSANVLDLFIYLFINQSTSKNTVYKIRDRGTVSLTLEMGLYREIPCVPYGSHGNPMGTGSTTPVPRERERAWEWLGGNRRE